MATELDYDNYIIAHHLDNKVYRIPMYPEEVSDTLTSIYRQSEILARSAPLQSWSGAGPRELSFDLQLHRDLDYHGLTEAQVASGESVGDIGKLMDEYQALNLPNYSIPMMVSPPKVTVKIGKNEIRITGTPTITLSKKKPIDSNGTYQAATLSVSVKEIKPYDAVEVTSLHNARGNKK